MANIRFWTNDHYLLNSMPKLRRVATKPQGAGGLGYIPKPIRNGGAGTSLISSRFAYRYVNQGRIRSSLTTNVVSRINENNKSALYSQGNNGSRNYWNRADRPLYRYQLHRVFVFCQPQFHQTDPVYVQQSMIRL